MRKIILMSSVSLDGFFEGPDRDGRLLFEVPDVRMNLNLEGTRTFGNGVVSLRYSSDRA